MTVLVDTGPILGFLLTRDDKHERAVRLLGPLLDGDQGPPAITDYILDEALTFLVARGVDRQRLDRAIAFLVGDGDTAGAFVLHPVGPDDIAESLRLIRRHRERRLSFTDCTSIAVMASRRIASIVSFDRGFDGIVGRVEAAPA